jgi:hypothetical protein
MKGKEVKSIMIGMDLPEMKETNIKDQKLCLKNMP